MRKKLLWWLGVSFLVGLFCSGALGRMAGDFEIPAKRVVKPVAPVREYYGQSKLNFIFLVLVLLRGQTF